MVYYFIVNELEKKKESVKDLENAIVWHSESLKKISEELEELNKLYEITLQRIDILKSRSGDLKLVLKNLNSELKINKDIISNAKVIDVITADVERDELLLNGLVDLNRDVLMRLIGIIFKEGSEEKIRNVIGISLIIYRWSKLPIFLWATKFRRPFVFSNIFKAKTIVVSGDGKKAKCAKMESYLGCDYFNSNYFANILLGERKITRGIAEVTIKGRNITGGLRMIGVLTELPLEFVCGFEAEKGILSWGLESMTHGIHSPRNKIVASSSANFCRDEVITMIVDVDKGNLEYLANGQKCAELKGEKRLCAGVYLAVQMCVCDEFEIVSLRR